MKTTKHSRIAIARRQVLDALRGTPMAEGMLATMVNGSDTTVGAIVVAIVFGMTFERHAGDERIAAFQQACQEFVVAGRDKYPTVDGGE